MKVSITILLALCALAYADYPAAKPSSHYGPPPSTGYGPPPTKGYGPPPTKGYGPPPTKGYGPPPTKGYGPPAPMKGYGPPRPTYPPMMTYGPSPSKGKGKGKGFSFKLPKFEMPKLPKFKLPKFEMPKLPKFELPKFKLPSFSKGKGKGGGYPAPMYPQPMTYPQPMPYPQPMYSQPKGKGKGIDFKGMMDSGYGMMKSAGDGLKDFKDKIAQKFHDVKAKILGFKGDILLKKGEKLVEWGQKLHEEAALKQSKYEPAYPMPSYPAPAPSYPAPSPSYPAPAPTYPVHVPSNPSKGYGPPKSHDIVAVPNSGYGVPVKTPAPTYGVPITNPAPTYGVPVSQPKPTYGAPINVPAPTYNPAPVAPVHVPAPTYGAPVPVPAPTYNPAPVAPVHVPAPTYGAPVPVPAPTYNPAPAAPVHVPAPAYSAPVPVPAPTYNPAPITPVHVPAPASTYNPAPIAPVHAPASTYDVPKSKDIIPAPAAPLSVDVRAAPQQGVHQHQYHHHHSSSSHLQGRRPIPVPFLVPVKPMQLLFPRPPQALVLGAPRPHQGYSHRPGGSGAYVPDSNTNGWLSTSTYSICPPYTMDQTYQTHTSTQTPDIDIRFKPNHNGKAAVGRTFGNVNQYNKNNYPTSSKPIICTPIQTSQDISNPQYPNVHPSVAIKPPAGLGDLPLADSLTNIHGNISDANNLWEFLNLTEHDTGHRDSRQYESIFIIEDDDSNEQLYGKHDSLILLDSLDNLPSLNYVNNNISTDEHKISDSDSFNSSYVNNLPPLDEIIIRPDMIKGGWKISENFPPTNINDQQSNESEQGNLSVITLKVSSEKDIENLREKEQDDIFLPPLIENDNHHN
ncbi:unnamed protein product [Meganyctiphanes norvegica]|uniref:Uncharacterized protein n=1 Tax=Meganyctiphanes norvegica TaxID=48144 RepID=A0AAV2QDC3_MEGNR